MKIDENLFKKGIQSDNVQLGIWSCLSSPVGAEIMADAGYDWIMLDTEHSPLEVSDLFPLMQAACRGGSSMVARVAWNDKVLIKRALDIGVQTLLVPFVQNENEAAAAVSACRYPPQGIRGVSGSMRANHYGRVKDYYKYVAEQLCLLVQVETLEALAEIENIAAVNGVDGVFIGPSDLSASMGHIGNPGHDDVQSAIKDAVGRIHSQGKCAGILAAGEEAAQRYIALGYDFVALGVDVALLTRAMDGLLQKFKG